VLLLAREREAVALINEAPARQFAAAYGLLVLDVPGFVALAVGRGVMPWAAGWAALDRLEEGNRTARGLINAGRELLIVLYHKGVR
jgi:predicted nucleic acid-binding protein